MSNKEAFYFYGLTLRLKHSLSEPMKKALLAFDKFKDALDALGACETVSAVIREHSPDTEIRRMPLSDGGEGFAQILTAAAGGELKELKVAGPRLKPVQAQYGWVQIEKLPSQVADILQIPAQGRLAVIEMAQAAGIESLHASERDPWHTSSFGVGEMMADAVASGADAILLGIGGSATIDLGVGALEALGLQFYDRDLQPVRQMTPARWKLAATVGSTLKLAGKMPPVRIACDVRNPLVGDKGATRVFGPQKGLKARDIPRMERWVDKMARRLLGCFGTDWDSYETELNRPGSGAAGGIAFGLRTALADVELVAGFELFSLWCRLPENLDWADTIFTGEGGLDAGTLNGKGPGSLIQRARPDQQVIFMAGRIDAEVQSRLSNEYPWVSCNALSPAHWPLEKALRETRNQLASRARDYILHS
ncbi:MAG: glycerate kinase [Opitutales bacterium]|nr:glycerate kinase [Opitutales bacterium]